jgi:hypothetical protein
MGLIFSKLNHQTQSNPDCILNLMKQSSAEKFQIIYPHSYAFSSPEKPILTSFSANSCFILTIYDKTAQKAMMTHLLAQSDLSSFHKILEKFFAYQIPTTKQNELEIYLCGGVDSEMVKNASPKNKAEIRAKINDWIFEQILSQIDKLKYAGYKVSCKYRNENLQIKDLNSSQNFTFNAQTGQGYLNKNMQAIVPSIKEETINIMEILPYYIYVSQSYEKIFETSFIENNANLIQNTVNNAIETIKKSVKQEIVQTQDQHTTQLLFNILSQSEDNYLSEKYAHIFNLESIEQVISNASISLKSNL